MVDFLPNISKGGVKMVTFNFNWKTCAAIGVSIVGIILASKVSKDDAKNALDFIVSSVFSSNKVVANSNN